MQLLWRDVQIGNGPAINTSLTAAETTELQRLANGGNVLEVGSAYGYSTVALALVARSVAAVDPHRTHGSYRDLVANLHANDLRHKVRIYVDVSQRVLPQLHDEGDRFDLVFIDGDHTEPAVEYDLRWASKLLKPGGVVACHDYGEDTCPGVRAALDRLLGGPGLLTDTLAVYSMPQLR